LISSLKEGIVKKGFLIGCCFLFLSCKDNNPLAAGFTVPHIEFAIGKTWHYAWSFTVQDSSGTVILYEADTVQVVVSGLNEQLEAFTNLVRLSSWTTDFGVSDAWYEQNDSSFVEVAYRRAGILALPKTLPARIGGSRHAKPFILSTPMFVQWMKEPAVARDSILIREEPRVVYRYPLVLSMAWTSFSHPFLQTREVVSQEIVSRDGRSYYCMKIKTNLPSIAPEIQWHDYVAAEGLIQRALDMEILITTENNPETGRKGHIAERLELLSIGVN
jgi:hypothetical protein